MRFLALAADYDGTLASHGSVDQPTLDALQRFTESGRKLVMVTGRQLDDLQTVFPHLELFSRVVAENGALLYDPRSKSQRMLAEPPNPAFVEELRQRGVPVSTGNAIVATWHPHEKTVLDVIREHGLELQVIFNKGAVMVLPSSINKGTGLKCALDELGLSIHNSIGVGDAENDHAFLAQCECSVAVANALDSLKNRADVVTDRAHGAGVAELIEQVLKDDLQSWAPRLVRHNILLGHDQNGHEVTIPPYGSSVLIAGPSGSGKSSVLTGILERLLSAEYQICLIDPEGDFDDLQGAVTVGDAEHPPVLREVLSLVGKFQNPVVNLLGVRLPDRPGFFSTLLPQLQESRVHTGRPHWLVIDEAHHLLPENWQPAHITMPQQLHSTIYVTVHPDHVSRAALQSVRVVLAVGRDPLQTMAAFADRSSATMPYQGSRIELKKSETLAWFRETNELMILQTEPSKGERRRHRRKYAEGDIQEKSFYFRGPEGKLNLRAQNLAIFVQMAEGVDEATWVHHLRQHDYSRWVRVAIKDERLADEVETIEDEDPDPTSSRRRIIDAIERQYTSAA